MASWRILEPPGADTADRAVLVRDGFAWLAFIVPPLWLLWYRLWFEAALVFAAGLVLTLGGEAAGLGGWASLLSLLLGLFVGMEGGHLRAAALLRRGWRDRGVVEAENRAEAEIRYLAGREDDEPVRSAPTPTPPALPVPVRPGAVPALGLLGYQGHR